jgi:hypothetical protein
MQKSSGRSFVFHTAAVGAAALLSIMVLASCERAKVDVTKLLAKDTPNAVIVPSPSATMDNIGSVLKSFKETKLAGLLKSDSDEITRKIGFNPLEKSGWAKAGLDVNKGIAIELEPVKRGQSPEDALLVLIGVKDEGLFDKTLKRLAKDFERAEIFRHQTYKQVKITTILRQAPSGETPLFVYTFYEGYVVLGDVSNGADGIKRMVDRKLLDGLDTSPLWQKLSGKVRSSADLKLFINEDTSVDRLPVAGTMKELVILKALQAHFKGAIGAVSFNRGVQAEAFVALSDAAGKAITQYLAPGPGMKIDQAMLKAVGDDALIVAKISIDLNRVLAKIRTDAPVETAHVMSKLFGRVAQYAGQGADEKAADELAGDFVMAVYPGQVDLPTAIQRARLGSLQGLFYDQYSASISNPESARKLSLSVEEGMKKQGIEVTERQINALPFKSAKSRESGRELSWAFRDRLLFIGEGGSGRFERNLALSQGIDGSIYQAIPQPLRDTLLSRDSQVLYLNFPGITKTLRGMIRVDQSASATQNSILDGIISILSKFREGTVVLKAQPEGLRAEAAVNLN